MKASELIIQLQKMIDELGDAEVIYADDANCGDGRIVNVVSMDNHSVIWLESEEE
jgi:hypothetical protein